ncbi:hypothetical protein [Piscinibacterium candidicorallinum]|uniref:Uncharacterized protein n=1 Tax=Piscinibacterium candidicorallinum TaxID=1793872 RepID=A0ABV7GYE3_9BURK
MLGLAYAVGLTIYAVILIAAILLGWRWGRSANGSLFRGGLVAAIVGLLVYLPGFWNHIPVVLEYRKLCEKDAGFTVIVPADQWIRSNGSRLDAVRGVNLNTMGERISLREGESEYAFFGGLLKRRESTKTWTIYGMQFIRQQFSVIDSANDAVLFRSVDYMVGPSEDVRFWLVRRSCLTRPAELLELDRAYLDQLSRNTK